MSVLSAARSSETSKTTKEVPRATPKAARAALCRTLVPRLPTWPPLRSCCMSSPEAPVRRSMATASSLYPRSGRFYGASLAKRIIQQTGNAGYDSQIGQIEDIPAKTEVGGLKVKPHEIHHSGPVQPVDRIADRTADNEAERHRGEP